MPDYIEKPKISEKAISALWGKKAWELIKAVNKPEVSKKRLTLILLANYRLQGAPITHVFKRSDAVSHQIHYGKWMKIPEYKAAYKHLMGLATKTFEESREEIEEDAIVQLGRAVTSLSQATSQAVHTLIEGLTAEQAITGFNFETKSAEIVSHEPDHTNRIRAANSILDRVPETAKNKKEDVSIKAGSSVTLYKQEDWDAL